MEIIPAIDIRKGRCVRLYNGDFQQETVYGDPIEMAKLWFHEGATRLHIVDLDGAVDGRTVNLNLISKMIKEIEIPVQVGGGIRDKEGIRAYLDIGVDRVIIGSAAIGNPKFILEVIEEFGSERIVVGIDAKDEFVAKEGWVETTDITMLDLAREMKEKGVELVVYTDINKDGTMAGPNIDSTKRLAEVSGLKVIASGGVAKIEDIQSLKEIEDSGVIGVIAGKALYSGSLDLGEALKIV